MDNALSSHTYRPLVAKSHAPTKNLIEFIFCEYNTQKSGYGKHST